MSAQDKLYQIALARIAELEKPRTCSGCRHLEPDEFETLAWEHRSGKCLKIEYALTVEGDGGFNGWSLEWIEINNPATFGCNYWEEKEK